MATTPLPLRDTLAIERTRLANERTFLAYARTALALLAGSVTLLFFKGPLLLVTATVLGGLSTMVFVLGLLRFLRVRRRIDHAEDGAVRTVTESLL